MKEIIKNRINALRDLMKSKGIDAYLIYGTDPHMSEYLPERWQTRAFISGFTGSYGMVAITATEAALWTDSRYFLQAEEQLSGTGIELVKLRTPGHPETDQWLKERLTTGAVVGTDEWCISVNQFAAMRKSLDNAGISFCESGDLLETIWNNRPEVPEAPVYEHAPEYACISRREKIEKCAIELEKAGADMQIVTALDDIAWTFNLRGSDVECNPVFIAYATVSANETALFIDVKKLSGEIRKQFHQENILVKDYHEMTGYLQNLPNETRVLIDGDRTNQAIQKLVQERCTVVQGLSVPCRLKALKSEPEIANIRNAMRKDGAALVEFIYWIKNAVGSQPVTEFTVAEKLTELRAKQPGFKGISFYPIVGYREHGAIVHFHVEEHNALPIEPEGFLLFDSGGQYLDGTTDTTRTIALGELTDEQKSDFTFVLKGMIALTNAVFPQNTRGYHLDILARKELWRNGLNYGHGTGHGVGYFLNVHEGPMSIRQEFNDRAIEEGMVLSNEPALYRQGQYGLRTENVIVCVKDRSTEFGNFLRFDTLTLCPIDLNAIEKSMLTDEERNWLNEYHQQVYNELSPLLTDELKTFLEEQTRAI